MGPSVPEAPRVGDARAGFIPRAQHWDTSLRLTAADDARFLYARRDSSGFLEISCFGKFAGRDGVYGVRLPSSPLMRLRAEWAARRWRLRTAAALMTCRALGVRFHREPTPSAHGR